MKTIRVALEESRVVAVDRAAGRLGLSRSGSAREALRAALERGVIEELEAQHRRGHTRKPVRKGEFHAHGTRS